jgi:hypothetical protein
MTLLKYAGLRTIAVIAFSSGMVSADLSQSISYVNDAAAKSAVGSPSFSDVTQYNSYDFYNSPLGLFEKEDAHLKVDMGYRSIAWHQGSSNDSLKQTCSAWSMPRVLVGSPKSVYMQLFYSPAALTDNTVVSQSRDLAMKRFGLTIAGQVPSGVFQLALRGNGYVGDETVTNGTDSRLLLGLDDLTISIGSRINGMVAFGIEGGVRAKLDTLRSNDNPGLHDRYFDGQWPVIGGFVDVKKEGLPVASAFSLTTGTSRFVYVTRNDVDQDPINGDSLAWKWQTIGNITNADITCHPALFLGYWKNSYQAYAPTASNDNLSVGDKRTGHDWKVNDFCFGLGASAGFGKYATSWFEYAHSAVGLEHGNAWPAPADKNEGYHRFSLGVESALHAIPALRFPSSIETFVRISYFNERENSGINTFQSETFGYMNTVGVNSRTNRYVPDFGVWGQGQRIIGTTLGLGSTFENKAISVDTYLSFLSKQSTVKVQGFEWGLDCGYCFK